MSESAAITRSHSGVAARLRETLEELLGEFPWRIEVTDWTGASFALGLGEDHWRGLPLRLNVKTEAAGRDLVSLDAVSFLDRHVQGEADIEGNIYLLASIRDHVKLSLPLWRTALRALANRAWSFQDVSRARQSVKSHYDIPQEALNLYLDREYLSYSCAMFEAPTDLDAESLTQAGHGREDGFDSLEKAQWRKFDDAAEYVAPEKGESTLDVGCGYGGQLRVLLERSPQSKAIGWTHSENQVKEGRKKLARFDPGRWELNEGDYRQEDRVFEHVTSTGMISHVGPRGLVPYVREVRKRIRQGGRYLHHALMTPYIGRPFDSEVGVAFNKKYVWPGFHWFTLGDHVRALEQNGFEIQRLTNLSPHYGKTTAAWHERLVKGADTFRELAGDATLRAWRIYLASASTGFFSGTSHVYRLYCRAV